MADPDACHAGKYLRCYHSTLDSVNLSLDTERDRLRFYKGMVGLRLEGSSQGLSRNGATMRMMRTTMMSNTVRKAVGLCDSGRCYKSRPKMLAIRDRGHIIVEMMVGALTTALV